MELKKDEIAVIIYFGVFIILFFIMAIILFVVIYQRKRIVKEKEYQMRHKENELLLFKSIIDTQEAEREKIAANIHDEIGPMIFALKIHLSNLDLKFKQNELLEDDFRKEKEYVNHIMEAVRTTSKNLSPKSLLRLGLVSSIKSFLLEVPNIEIDIQEHIDEKVTIDNELGINVYRIVLEIFNNILKHDNPCVINVNISVSDEAIKFVIEHNGKGITNEQFTSISEKSEGLGLKSLKSRITLLNAELDYQNIPKAKVSIKIPLYHEKND